MRAIVFAAVGTAGQRCTSLRRLIVHDSVADGLLERLERAYASVAVGDPREPGTLCGPLISEDAFTDMQAALDRARAEGATISGGERVLADEWPEAYYVRPAIARMPHQTDLVREETFAPLLYAVTYSDLDEAIAVHNDVPQGLSSCVFTGDLRESERFLSAAGSDCGIANVNIGPSGAEIGGAFGGEKETGGGRESGLGRLEGLHAPADGDDQLLDRAAPRPGDRLRRRVATRDARSPRAASRRGAG